MKHLRSDCTAHHITFGGGCLNCGAGMETKKQQAQRKLDRINARLQWMDEAAAFAPENLYCDGERTREDVQAEYRDLYREQKKLIEFLG